ncbi:MAG: hypothetical protein HQM08_27720 [Candidatus Riflebacteria bacterium]|nr:hypothetical protein [Candidatus Riflebacteria bacterium]
MRQIKAIDEVIAAILRDRVAQNAELTCDRRESGSVTGCRNPSLENSQHEKNYPLIARPTPFLTSFNGLPPIHCREFNPPEKPPIH